MKNYKGFSNIVLIGLLGGLVGLCVFIVQKGFLADTDEQAVSLMEELKDEVRAAFKSQVALQASIRRNANRFACLSDGGNACASRGGQFILYTKAESVQAEPLSQIPQSRGMSLSKAGCHDFPSANCPLRVETTWRALAAPKGCSNERRLALAARIVLNSGTLFMDWKEDFEQDVKVQLNAKALCRCQGKRYANGECVTEENTNQLAQFPRDQIDERDELDERYRDERREIASEPVCTEDVLFRGESFPISDVNEAGIGYIELDSTGADCQTFDTYRFKCVKQGKGRARTATWVYLGVTRGQCADSQQERFPATEDELFQEEIPEGDYLGE